MLPRLGGERSGGRGGVLRTAGWGLPLSRHLGNSPLSTDLLQTRGRQDLLEALRNAPPTAGFHWQIAESQCVTVTQPAGFLSYCKQVFGKENPALLLLHQASPPSFAKKLGYIKIRGSHAGWAISPSCLASRGSCSILTYLLRNSFFFLAFLSFFT